MRSEVQILPDPPDAAQLLLRRTFPFRPVLVSFGAIAQLGERLLCKQEVVGSIPSGSTIQRFIESRELKVEVGFSFELSARTVLGFFRHLAL